MELFLCRYSALHGVHHAGELSQKIVPRRIHHPAAVLTDEIKEGKLVRFYGGYRGGFVVLHEATETDYIGAEDCSELAAKAFLFHADTSWG
ncbi:MAG: hypothetical protein MUC57_16150 [Desulfobacterales bacterium]|nr:hypothetical protein [Desulfobacterales bacterium]